MYLLEGREEKGENVSDTDALDQSRNGSSLVSSVMKGIHARLGCQVGREERGRGWETDDATRGRLQAVNTFHEKCPQVCCCGGTNITHRAERSVPAVTHPQSHRGNVCKIIIIVFKNKAIGIEI